MDYLQTEDELKSHLVEQVEFLKNSSKSYDNGFLSEAKRLAVVIRVFLHDTNQSISLMTLLKKKNILFYDTALDYNPKNLMPTMGLIVIKMGPNGGEYVPPLDDGAPERYQKGKIPFEKWWNKIVFVDKSGTKLTRKELVLAVSNKDGGAHIDPKLNKAYADLTRFNSLGWKFVKNGVEQEVITPPELVSIRQIAHEVLKTLKDEFPEYFK